MTNHAVHWAEGIFLRPHHFQAAERSLKDLVTRTHDWSSPYPYGVRKIDIDTDALANWRIVLRECHLRLRDGTQVCFPDDANLSPLDIPPKAFDRQNRLTVFLGIPHLKLGQSNASAAGTDQEVRYEVIPQEVEDENDAGRPQTIDLRWSSLKLLLETDSLTGYETIPIFRLLRGERAEAPPELDREYFPPLLACDAWPVLRDDIIDSLTNFIGSRVEQDARRMFDRKVAFESGHREDLELLFQLHSLNTASGYLMNLRLVRGIHPVTAYMELCRVAGMLAIFRPDRRMPSLPLYDHDDLGTCFWAVKRWIEGDDRPPEPAKRVFVGAGLQMQVKLEKDWLGPAWGFYVGVESTLPYQEVVKLMGGDFNMKVGSSRQVDLIFARAQSGVKPEPDPSAPRALPGRNWTYFKVDRHAHAWKDVEETLSMGIRINDSQIDGRIDGNHEIKLKLNDGRVVKMVFALFALPPELTR
ncbi:type VI secretion system-associated protein [Planctomycetia bacterium]|nr:type VI secretion system-associated protein [Planctomycetia bacterium]